MPSDEYSRLKRNLKRRMLNAMDRGYYFLEDVSNPKDIKQAREYTEKFYEYSVYEDRLWAPDQIEGKISGIEGRKLERRRAAKKGIDRHRYREMYGDKIYEELPRNLYNDLFGGPPDDIIESDDNNEYYDNDYDDDYDYDYDYEPINDGVIQELRELLERLTYFSGSYIDNYRAKKSNQLLLLLDLNVDNAMDDDVYREYVEYIEAHNSEIKSALEGAMKHSSEEEMDFHFTTAAHFINHAHALDADSAEELNYLMEMF